MPAIGLPQKAADDRGDERAEVDPGEIELEARVAARVTVAVQIADLADEVAAQAPRARDQQRKRGEERRVEPHREMPGRHQPRAEGDRSPPPDAVADHATDDRHEIHQPDVKPEDLARQRGHRQRAGNAFDRGAKSDEAGDVLDVARSQQLPDHVEDEQRLHPVERDAVPQLGPGQIGQPARLTEQVGGRAGRGRRHHI